MDAPPQTDELQWMRFQGFVYIFASGFVERSVAHSCAESDRTFSRLCRTLKAPPEFGAGFLPHEVYYVNSASTGPPSEFRVRLPDDAIPVLQIVHSYEAIPGLRVHILAWSRHPGRLGPYGRATRVRNRLRTTAVHKAMSTIQRLTASGASFGAAGVFGAQNDQSPTVISSQLR